MLDSTKRYFVCGLPYQLSIAENLLDNEAVADEMSEAGFNETKWSMEMECVWFGDMDGTFSISTQFRRTGKSSIPCYRTTYQSGCLTRRG